MLERASENTELEPSPVRQHQDLTWEGLRRARVGPPALPEIAHVLAFACSCRVKGLCAPRIDSSMYKSRRTTGASSAGW
jgi:hypothetical protein